MPFNSLPNDILEWLKLKAFADDKINVTEKLKLLLVRVENIVGQGSVFVRLSSKKKVKKNFCTGSILTVRYIDIHILSHYHTPARFIDPEKNEERKRT